MTEPVRRDAVWGLAYLLLAGYAALSIWLFFWQIIKHEEYRGMAAANRHLRATVPARRGAILDTHGTVLAASEPVRTVCVDPLIGLVHPDFEGSRRLVSETIAAHLDLDVETVWQKTEPRWFTNQAGTVVADRYEVLKHKVRLEDWQALTNALRRLDYGIDLRRIQRTNRLALQAMQTQLVFSREDYLRRYPCGDLAPHVIGFARSLETNVASGTVFEDRGWHGIELSLNPVLAGTPGWRLGMRSVEARPGLNVVLTLDATLQRMTEQALRQLAHEWSAEAAVAVLVRPRTGDILALVSLPDFDPANPKNVEAHKNRVISEMLEPGSTMKAFTFAQALEMGAFRWDEPVFCHYGIWHRPADRVRDFSPYGELSFLEVLMKSSNIGTGKLALERIPRLALMGALERFGFGRPTGIHLPGEAAGLVNHPRRDADYLRVSFGQYVSATPLQVAMAYSALANDGLLMRPRLVDRIEDEEGRVLMRFAPMPVQQAVSRATATNLTHGLRAVMSERGTGRSARLDRYSSAGKTGTAQIFDLETRSYLLDDNYPSLVGYFPATRPEVCLLIGVIRPWKPGSQRYGGGAVVGPTWKRLAEEVANYLRIPPDLGLDPEWETPGGTWPVGPIAAHGQGSTQPPARHP